MKSVMQNISIKNRRMCLGFFAGCGQIVLICLAFPVMAESLSVSPALRALVASVQDSNPAIKAAQAAVDAARARTVASGQPLYNPSLTLEAEDGDVATTTVGLSQTLDWSDKRGAERDIANAILTAAETELATTQRQLTGELLEALARFQTAREQHQLALKRSKLMQEFAATAERRRIAGDISKLEATLARLAQSEAQVQQARASTALIEAETILKAITGPLIDQGTNQGINQASTTWPELPTTLPPPPSSVDVDAALMRLPEIRLRLAQIQTAQARTRLATRSRRPDPTFSLRAGKEGDSSLVGVGVEIPLFVRRNLRAEIEAAGYDITQTEQTLDEARRRTSAQIEGALARYRIAAEAWQVWETSGLPDLMEQIALLQRLWEAGELSTADYLVQAHQTVDAQMQSVELLGDVRQAAIAWLQAFGQIESWLDLPNPAPVDTTHSGAQK